MMMHAAAGARSRGVFIVPKTTVNARAHTVFYINHEIRFYRSSPPPPRCIQILVTHARHARPLCSNSMPLRLVPRFIYYIICLENANSYMLPCYIGNNNIMRIVHMNLHESDEIGLTYV